MFYKLFEYLNENTSLPGMRVGEYISFRSAAAIITSLLISIFFGKRIIRFLRRQQIGEEIRDLGLQGQLEKRGTPTMGGIIIILAMFVPVLLFGDLSNVYIQLMLISTLWLGFIGGLDDYIKVFRHNKEGLNGRFKIVGQVGLGIIVGTVMCFSEDIVVREHTTVPVEQSIVDEQRIVHIATRRADVHDHVCGRHACDALNLTTEGLEGGHTLLALFELMLLVDADRALDVDVAGLCFVSDCDFGLHLYIFKLNKKVMELLLLV